MFRDEERFLDKKEDPFAFYREVIIPYKTELELYFIVRQSLGLYFTIIFLTAWIIIFPNSKLPERMLSDLPESPPELAHT